MQALDLLVYGDSIFETVLESVVGHPVSRAAGTFAVWQARHPNSTTEVLALAGEACKLTAPLRA